MRFSMKWALAAMAYVALAAMAIGQDDPATSHVVWAITAAAGCFAILDGCYARGEQRAQALGFLLFFATNFLCLYIGPRNVPSNAVLLAAGYEITDKGAIFLQHPTGTYASLESPMLRTANAVGTMAAGLVGSVVGGQVYRRRRKPD